MSTNDAAELSIQEIERRIIALDREREALAKALLQRKKQASTLDKQTSEPRSTQNPARVNMNSPTEAKLALFRELFRGREDVFPKRWENAKTGKAGYAPACANEWMRGVCGKPQVKCGECINQSFLTLSDIALRSHLQDTAASATLGVYPLLKDETCWFLAIDFDKKNWVSDSTAYLDTCRLKNVPAALERSRSGNGGHVWIFFSEPVPAAEARRLGAHLLTETLDRRPDIGFDSYDRFFPSQDTMPAGGFGNLIALPLQGTPRRNGNSAFVDANLQPFDDQWAFLSSLRRMSRAELETLVEAASADGRILGVRLPINEDEHEPWNLPPSKRSRKSIIIGSLPESVSIFIGSQLFVDRRSLPPAIVSRIVRLAAFQNPEFYAAQSMRLPTFGKPRIISCAELFANHIGLPRGCYDSLTQLLKEVGIRADVKDERNEGVHIEAAFLGTLTVEQESAVAALRSHETGVLAATTAFGKTVAAINMIAERGRNTLILVHRTQLQDQWIARLSTFLNIDPKSIGVVRAGKRKPTGIIDVALMQSLIHRGTVSDLVGDYGHIIVDECHHVSAVSFEEIIKQAKAKFVLGLSATITRKDGHHPIIFMQCGPVRYRVDARKQAALRPFTHKVFWRNTSFRNPDQNAHERSAIQNLYGLIGQDEARNDLIFSDVISALENGRSPVVLTERKDHLDYLEARLSKFCKNVVVLKGGMTAKSRQIAMDSLGTIPESEERLVLATGRYLGEGFDDARLDTLFLTMPISWHGTLAQYAGRLHRMHSAKREVRIYDYVDINEPMFAKMAAKRAAGYRNIGYEASEAFGHSIGSNE